MSTVYGLKVGLHSLEPHVSHCFTDMVFLEQVFHVSLDLVRFSGLGFRASGC